MSAYSPTPSPESVSFAEPNDDDDDESTETVVSRIFDELVDEVTLGLAFDVHRMNKMGTLFISESDPESMKRFAIVDERGLDVFGQVPMKKQLECICPNCSRNLAASRFAPHLEKCMGMGRNSSRIASRRIANAGSKKEGSDNESDNDGDDDYDWSHNRGTKRKKDKTNNSKNKRQQSSSNKYKSDAALPVAPSGGHDSSLPYVNMSQDERKALLHNACGVISEHTRRMCTRSFRCPQHSDEQRRAVRHHLLTGKVRHHLLTGRRVDRGDEAEVDIDGYQEGESQELRDHLQWEAVSNPSPTDSTSTTNSSAGSKKRRGTSKKSSSHHRRRGRPTNTHKYDIRSERH